MKKLAILACLAFMSSMLYAQKESSTVKIRIEKTVDGKRQIIEREIDASGMTEAERDAIIESIQDSLIDDIDGNRKMKIVIQDDRNLFEGDNDEDFEFNTENDGTWEHYDSDKDRQVHIYKKHKKGGNDWSDDFEFEMERLGDNMKMLGEEIPHQIQRHLPRIYSWTDNAFAEIGSSPIRSLDVFPNQPESEVINVKFHAPEEGDISITVIDTKGKGVAQKESKAFKGEYVGQINVKKGVKGTHFVIVSQGDDGTSRKVVLD
jgi:hypothetical protein